MTLSDTDSKNQLKIAVALHKPYRVPKDPAYIPVHVGAALHPGVKVAEDEVEDDEFAGNISQLNCYYSELTALWQLWKDERLAADYQGLVHYRRYLGSASFLRRHNRDRFARIASGEEIMSLVQETGILLPHKRRYWIETISSHYSHTMDGKQLKVLREILKTVHPECIPAFDRHMSETSTHILNICVMRRDLLCRWCAFLFPILEEMTKTIAPSSYDAFGARYPGRISEILLDVWLETNNLDYRELPLVSTEPINWWKKGSAFLAAKFCGKKYSKSF